MPKETSQFKKGISGNPSGRPSLPIDVLKAKNINKVEFERVLNDFLMLPKEQLKVILDDDASTVMEQVLASFLDKAIAYGDHQRLGLILDRLIGKIKDPEDKPPNPFEGMAPAEQLVFAEKVVAALKQRVGK